MEVRHSGSPPAIRRNSSGIASGDIEWGRGYRFMQDYDERVIEQRLQKLIDGSGATTWDELIRYIDKFFEWIE